MTLLDDINNTSNFVGVPGGMNLVARILEKQVEDARRAAAAEKAPKPRTPQAPVAPVDPFAQLQQQLFQQINSVPTHTTPIDELRKMAQTQIGAQYDPLISALTANQASEKQRSQRNQNDARGMYDSLAKDFASQIPGITAQMRQAQDEASNRYNQAAQQSQHDYSQQAAQQQQILNQLGLQSAQQATQSQSAADEKYFQNQANLQKQQDLSSLQQQGNSSQTYQQNLSDTSRMAGTNAVEDLRNQLSDFLQSSQSQLGTLQAQKTSGIDALLQQLISSDQQNAQTQHQSDIDNLMKMYNFQLSAARASSDANLAQQKLMQSQQNQNQSIFSGTSGPQGAANYLAESLGGSRPNTASQILQLINDTMADPNVVAGRHPQLDNSGKTMTDPVTGKPMTIQNTDQYVEDLLRSKMESSTGGWDVGDVNAAINALLAYLGKLR